VENHLDTGLVKYIYKTARQNFWRVAPWYELEDLISDGFLVAAKCERRYSLHGNNPNDPAAEPGSKDDRRQFMAFFMKAYHNYIVDLAKRRSECLESSFTALGIEQVVEYLAPVEQEVGTMSLMLAQAPEKVRAVLARALERPDAPFLRKTMIERGGRVVRARIAVRETSEERLDRITGVAGATELLREFILGFTTRRMS
jgi:hypothetical protein